MGDMFDASVNSHKIIKPVPFTLNGRFLVQSITGVQRVAREVLAELDSLAVEGAIEAPRLLLPAKGEIVQPPPLGAIKLERVGRRGGHAWEQLDLPAHCGLEPLLCLGNTAPIARLLSRAKPVVTMVHDLSYKYFPAAYSWKFRAYYSAIMPLILRRSDQIVTVSHAEERSIRKHFRFLRDSRRLCFIQNGGIPDSRVKVLRQGAALRSADERPFGLYLGSLTRRKNAEGVIAAAVSFLRRYPQMRFVVIGATGASFENTSLDVPQDVAERFEFWGQINDGETIYEACQQARFLLFPSFYEASPLPPIEAMTFGCPVVASHIPSLEERCGQTAIYCDPNDLTSINDAIDVLMADAQVWQAFSDRSRDWVDHFTWRGQALGLVDLMRALV